MAQGICDSRRSRWSNAVDFAASCHYDDDELRESDVHHHCPSALLKDEEDVLVCPVAPPSLLKVTDAGAAHPVRIRWVVVENTAGGPVEAAHDHKVTLVLRFPAETLLAHGQEAAVFDRRGAEFTHQDNGVDQHYGNVTLLQMRLDFLNRHRTFLHHHTFVVCFKEEIIHSVFFCVKMFLIEGLIPKALINAQSLCAKAVSESKMAHEVGQVNSPHTLCQLQIPACSLKLLITDGMEVLEDHSGAG